VTVDDLGDEHWFDTYDAVAGLLFAKYGQNYELYKVLSLEELFDIKASEGVRVVIIGDCFVDFRRAQSDSTYQCLQEFKTKLLNFQAELDIVVIPPLDYLWYFEAKHEYVPAIATLFNKHVRVLPSRVVWGTSSLAQLAEWAKHLPGKGEKIVLKRSHSGCCEDVETHENFDSVVAFFSARPKIKRPKIPKKNTRFKFPYILQQHEPLFMEKKEFKMFVINGVCQYGHSTTNSHGSHTYISLCHVGAPNAWENIGQHAARIAEDVCKVVSSRHADAKHFLRVDLLCTDPGHPEGATWILNELEYFGNAHIPIDSFGEEPGLMFLDALVDALHQWICEYTLDRMRCV
jgi:hypothetical protein